MALSHGMAFARFGQSKTQKLEQWHEIHDAYVTFFGDEHRPAAVRWADRGKQYPYDEITIAPGTIIPVNPGGSVRFIPPLTSYGTFPAAPYLLLLLG